MRWLGVMALVTHAATTQVSSQPGTNNNRPPQVTSPEVLESGGVTFRVYAASAQSVQLISGDMPGTGRGLAMSAGEDKVWSIALPDAKPGTYRYQFNVDGLTVLDPRNPLTSESNDNSWSLVHLPGNKFSDTLNHPHGAVSEISYFSTVLGRHRRMHVYTPPGYESSTAEYPVFYLLHGASDSDDSWTTVGRAGFILDNLLANGKIKPMIVAMPAGHTASYRWGSPFSNDFEKEFAADILPAVEKRYRVKATPENRAIAGLSMGGAQTINIAFDHPDWFRHIGVFSSGIFGINRPNPNQPGWVESHQSVLADAQLKQKIKLLWFATGDEDFLLETTRATVDMFKSHEFPVTYRETEGGHTWIKWRDYLNEFAPLLFQ